MANETVVIDVVANFRNNTSSGLGSARASVDRFVQSIRIAQTELQRLSGMTANPQVTLNDHVTSTLNTIRGNLGTLGGTTVSPEVTLTNNTASVISAINSSLAALGGTTASPTVTLTNNTASVISAINSSLAALGGTTASPTVTLTNNTASVINAINRSLAALGGTTASPTVSIINRATSPINMINRSLSALGGRTVRAGVRIIDYATKPLTAIKNSLFSIKGLVAAIGTAWAANKLLAEPLSIADAYSGAKIGFSTLLGDKEGQSMMDELDQFAKETPFKTSGVIDNAQKMMSMGWDAKDIIKDMRTIGDAAAATGKGDQGFESIVRALSQIKTKGKLSTEELNQLAEAGIAAKAMLAENLGYGTGDSGIAKMTADLEDGAIASDKAIQALLQGMKQFEGTMEKTANETASGLKSQLEDTFEINILRKWGQGLQDGAKRGLGSILDLLNKSERSLHKFGNTVYEIGKELSNWAADKMQNTIDKILEVTSRDDFKNASLGGKIKLLWDEVIAEPFSDWWERKNITEKIAEKAGTIGEKLGSGLSKGLMALFGVSDEVLGGSVTIGGSFAQGFKKGFEGEKVWDAFTDAAGKAIKKIFNSGTLGKFIVAALGLKVAAGITSGISTVLGAGRTLWSGTGATTATGGTTLVGGGISGAITSLGYAVQRNPHTAGSFFHSTSGSSLANAMTTTQASIYGGVTAVGIAGGIAGLANSVGDLSSAIASDTRNDKKLYNTRSATKAGMVGAGALAGAAIGSVIPVVGTGVGAAVGAGLGGIATFLAGNKVADSISGVSKTTAELEEEIDDLKNKRLEDRFGKATLSANDLSEKVQEIFGTKSINRVNKFNTALSNLNLASQSAGGYLDDINYTSARITAKEKLSVNDIEEYKTTLTGYSSSVSELLSSNKTASRSAFKLLYGKDTKGLQKMTKNINKTYSDLENKLAKKSEKLNNVIAKAFEDGKITINEEKKINEVVSQIEKIQDKIDERLRQKEQAENNAAYDLIGKKYKTTDLTSDSFKSLVSELDEQSETSLKAYDDAYIQAKAELDIEFDGKTNSKKYKKALAEIEQKWREGKADTIKKQVTVSLEVLNTNYKSEINKLNTFIDDNVGENSLGYISTKMKKATQTNNGGLINTNWTKDDTKYLKSLKDSFLSDAGVDDALQKEMKEMYEVLKPQEEDLLELKKSYEDAGKEIPTWIEDSLADIGNIKLMSGDTNSFYKILGEQIAKDDKNYAQALINAKEKGEKIPQAIIDGINEGLASEKITDINYDTNLKVTANEKNVDTSELDKTTKEVVEKLEDKGIIYTQDGEVKIKTKDGKIDTSDLDKKTKKKLKKLEKEGIIEIDKEGKVTFTTKEVDTTSVDDAIKHLEDKDLIVKLGSKIVLNGKEIDYDDVDNKTQEALDKLEEEGIIEIDKKGKVTVKATVDTTSASEKANSETKSEVGKDVSVDKTANVTVTSNTTGAEEAATASKGEFTAAADSEYAKTVSEAGAINITGVTVSGAGTALANAWASFKEKAKSIFSQDISATGRVKYQIGTSGSSSNSKDPKKANGGYVDKAIRTIVGEAGPEMIIPLSANRRQRGKSLWERAGRAMGLYDDEKTYMNANGGLYGVGSSRLGDLISGSNSGNSTSNEQQTRSNGTVKVDVGGITIKIESTGNGVQQDIQTNADTISGQIAAIIEEAFKNMPIPV